MKHLTNIRLFIILIIMVFVLPNCKKDNEKASNSIRILSIEPDFPDTLNFGEFVIITTDYSITNDEGARMWVQPFTDGAVSPGYIYSSSTVYTGSGIREVGISVEEGDEEFVEVDQLRIVSVTPDQSEILFEEYMDVSYIFRKE
jgi:hypothetical protein